MKPGKEAKKQAKLDRKQEKLEKKCSNNFVRGALAAVAALVVFVALPLIIQDALLPELPKDIDTEGISKLLDRWVVAGVPLVIVAFPAKYFGLGTGKRLAFTAIQLVMKLAWLLYVINFGDLSGVFAGTYGGQDISVDILLRGFLVLLCIPVPIRIAIAYCDYRDHRDTAAGLGPEDTTRDDGIRVKGKFS